LDRHAGAPAPTLAVQPDYENEDDEHDLKFNVNEVGVIRFAFSP
jgi:hypothetical protein